MNSESRWRIAFCTLLRVEFTYQTREAVFHHLNTGKRGYKLYDVQWNKICLRHFWNVDITFQLRKRFRRRRQADCKNKKFLIRYKSSQYNLHDFLWIEWIDWDLNHICTAFEFLCFWKADKVEKMIVILIMPPFFIFNYAKKSLGNLKKAHQSWLCFPLP